VTAKLSSTLTPFARRVLSVVSRIPAGRVATYGDIARRAGRPGAARAVGNIMRTARRPGLPYHRVIASGGQIGGYGGNVQLKISLLIAEGHVIRRRRIAGFLNKRW
jgi:methylated-DNA-[protein]-cysteine S-methyltransferase